MRCQLLAVGWGVVEFDMTQNIPEEGGRMGEKDGHQGSSRINYLPTLDSQYFKTSMAIANHLNYFIVII